MPLRKAIDQSTQSSFLLAKDSAFPHTTASRPRSGSQLAQPSVTSVAEHEVSHFNLSETTSRNSPSSLRGKKPESRFRYGQRRETRKRRDNPGSLRTRHDSVHNDYVFPGHSDTSSSANSVQPCGYGLSTNPADTARQSRTQSLPHCDFRFTLESQVDDDAKGGAESLQSRSRKRDLKESDPPASTHAFDSTRPYSSSLGTLDIPRKFHARKTSSPSRSIEVISDAGDQQRQHQEQQSVQANDLETEDSGLETSLASLPELGPRYALQTKILEARVRTRKLDGRDRRFIPRESLRRVVHPTSVAQELRGAIPPLSAEEVLYYSKLVCEQIETTEIRHGKYQIRSYRKVFALLVLVEAASSIASFLREGVSDQDLPLTLIERDGKWIFFRRGDRQQAALQCFTSGIWSLAKLEKFEEYQWLLLAAFFSPDENGIVKHYELQDQHTLPFVAPQTAQEVIADKIGGYGKVLMVHIHRDHHNFGNSRLSQRGFAIKQQIDEEDREAFKQEAFILRKFSGMNAHRHMVSLLATYEHCNKFHLVFYRADGDLLDYWENSKFRPQLTHGNVTWMASQCAGLADGLSRLHKILSIEDKKVSSKRRSIADVFGVPSAPTRPGSRHVQFIAPLKDRVGTDSSIQSDGARVRTTSPVRAPKTQLRSGAPSGEGHFDEDLHPKEYGRHGDISPKNILLYPDDTQNEDECSQSPHVLSGILVIADFGQAEVNSLKTKTKRRDVANTMTYRPPECDLEFASIRQSYDIWCLGCVYLEFVAWILGGRQLLRRFAKQRSAPDILQSGKETDTFFQASIHQDTKHFVVKTAVTDFIHRLHQDPNCTAYIHELLDLIQHGMIVIDSAKRKSCVELRDQLSLMRDKCLSDTDYATVATPHDTSTLSQPLVLTCDSGPEITAYAENVVFKDPAIELHPIPERGKDVILATQQRSRVGAQRYNLTQFLCCLLLAILWFYSQLSAGNTVFEFW